jgi:hypothetical protein
MLPVFARCGLRPARKSLKSRRGRREPRHNQIAMGLEGE